MLEAHDVWRVFDKSPGAPAVLRGASLRVGRGECVGLAGPSGSGKTTFLQILAGIDTPTRGRVDFDGVDWFAVGRRSRASTRLRKLGIVFSDHNLCAALTAGENVDLPLAWMGLTWAERRARVHGALEAAGALAFESKIPGDLSAGERQRVAVARALAGGPAVVLADEPTSHLDAATALVLTDCLVARAREAGAALLLASHDEAVLAKMDRIARLRDGMLT
jgi:ABC-type lipoprotein export system ATPase subunit